ATAPRLFQRYIDGILKPIDGSKAFLDDILVTGTSKQDNFEKVIKVLTVLAEAGLKVNLKKCRFLQHEIEYMGYRLSEKGSCPNSSKVDAISKAPAPENVSQLRSYLGLLNFYHKFLPNISCILEPLHRLLEAKATWHWTSKHQKAFEQTKK